MRNESVSMTESKLAQRLTAITMVLLVLLFFGGFAGDVYGASESPTTRCGTVYTYEKTTGTVLYDKEGDVQRTPASITKVMTAILVLENLDTDTVVTVPEEAVFPTGSNIDLKAGEQMTVEDLLHGLLIPSGNDAALALAIEVAGSEEAFVSMMNDKAAEIGATHTHFLVCNGYTESTEHTTTAEDLAIIVDYALNMKGFRSIVSKPEYTIPATNMSEERELESTNRLLHDDESVITVNGQERHPLYEGTFGIKTGMMLSSGYCLVAGVKKEGMSIMNVCLMGEDEDARFEDTIAMTDWALENYEIATVAKPEDELEKRKVRYASKVEVPVRVEGGAYAVVEKGYKEEDLRLEVTYFDDEEKDIDEVLSILEGNKNITPDMWDAGILEGETKDSLECLVNRKVEGPLEEGEQIGVATIYYKDQPVGQRPVVTATYVKKGGPWTRFYLKDRTAYVGFSLIILIILRQFIGREKRKQEQARRNRMGPMA